MLELPGGGRRPVPAVELGRFERRLALGDRGRDLLAKRVDLRPLDGALVEDRFTLVSLDAYTGDYIEVRLYGARGAELARESLYEDE